MGLQAIIGADMMADLEGFKVELKLLEASKKWRDNGSASILAEPDANTCGEYTP
jgi:hypothetical protein